MFPTYISRFPLFLGVRGSHPGLRRYRPISRPIFLVVRFNSFIHSFQYHSVHQRASRVEENPRHRQLNVTTCLTLKRNDCNGGFLGGEVGIETFKPAECWRNDAGTRRQLFRRCLKVMSSGPRTLVETLGL